MYVNTVANVTRIFLAYPYDNNLSRGIYYFDNYVNPKTPPLINVNYNIYGMHGYFNDSKTIGRLFVAGSSIGVFDAITLRRIYTPYSDSNIYKKIYTCDGIFTVAISETNIVYTVNGGANWLRSSVPNTTYSLNDICIWDLSHAIAVGNNGVILYTINGAKTWSLLNLTDINAMGNGSNIINTSKNLTAVRMTDSYTFSISCVSRNYVDSTIDDNGNIITTGTTGITDMFYLHLPDLLNRELSPSILDICGNMTITGDIHINDYGKLQSNNNVFHMIDKKVQTVYFARDASNIHIGNIIFGGMTTIQHRLTTFDDVSMNNRLYVWNDVSFSGNLYVNKDVSMNSRLFVGQDVSLNANLFVKGDVSMNSRLFVGQDVSLNSNLFV